MTADRARQVAAEVAARYGVAVSPDVVRLIPRGVSSESVAVWDGVALRYPDGAERVRGISRAHWAAQAAAARQRQAVAPHVAERREALRALHGAGLDASAIAVRLGVSYGVIYQDHAALTLDLNPHQRGPDSTVQARRDLIARMAAEGAAADQIAAAILAGGGGSFTPESVQWMARRHLQLRVPLRAGGRRKPAPDLARRAEVVAAAERGLSCAEIARVMRTDDRTIKRHLEGAGKLHLLTIRRGSVEVMLRDVARLHAEGLGIDAIAARIGRSKARAYHLLRQARQAGVGAP